MLKDSFPSLRIVGKKVMKRVNKKKINNKASIVGKQCRKKCVFPSFTLQRTKILYHHILTWDRGPQLDFIDHAKCSVAVLNYPSFNFSWGSSSRTCLKNQSTPIWFGCLPVEAEAEARSSTMQVFYCMIILALTASLLTFANRCCKLLSQIILFEKKRRKTAFCLLTIVFIECSN